MLNLISIIPFHLNVQIVLSSELMLLRESEKSRCEASLFREFPKFPALRKSSLLLP